MILKKRSLKIQKLRTIFSKTSLSRDNKRCFKETLEDLTEVQSRKQWLTPSRLLVKTKRRL